MIPDVDIEYSKVISQIIQWFKNEYADLDGIPYYLIDGKTGKPVDGRNLLAELDDYLPFFWMLGEEEYVNQQILYLRSRFRQDPLLFRFPQIRRTKGIRLPPPVRTWIAHSDLQDYVEIFYGLLEIYELSRKPEILELTNDLWNSVMNSFLNNGDLMTWLIRCSGTAVPVSDALAGMFIEIAASLYNITQNSSYLDLAKQWASSWEQSECFQKYGLFPSIRVHSKWLRRIPGMQRRILRIELGKANTSVASGLFALACPPISDPAALSMLNKWTEGLNRFMRTPEGVYAHNPRLNEAQPYGPVLSTNFLLIDLFCDMYFLTREHSYLDTAVRIADVFLSHQSSRTGLFPDDFVSNRSYLDGNTDLIVSLIKLAELTGNDSYRTSAQFSLSGILKFHRNVVGFVRDVDLDSGQIINSDIETRFVSLLLKPLLLFEKNLSIYTNQSDWSKFRDR